MPIIVKNFSDFPDFTDSGISGIPGIRQGFSAKIKNTGRGVEECAEADPHVSLTSRMVVQNL